MHFEILVEDRSGQKALDILVLEIIGAQGTLQCDCISRSWPQWAEAKSRCRWHIHFCLCACMLGREAGSARFGQDEGASLIKR